MRGRVGGGGTRAGEVELDALVNPRCNLTVRSGRRLKLPATAEQFQAAAVSEGSASATNIHACN